MQQNTSSYWPIYFAWNFFGMQKTKNKTKQNQKQKQNLYLEKFNPHKVFCILVWIIIML